ncbi:patatin-like phospholipase family protein [Pontibacter sp. G13]|uniref:patatin-like phospholipase family protein n=1 Tax=Pontibacter sp. G13 TaxID=3074898 RepID=UPI00288A0E1B|nr:patatin-like phospholipase family protein [Pontibacter sp. G13]WNJ18906.1 patatin-like phospholipase family protein [Pontibacter sp. G13]
MPQTRKIDSIGLALSGGGTKGIAHIGVLKLMEELNIPTHVVAGTSAGSIVGSLHAAGHSADAILEFFMGTSLFSFSNIFSIRRGIRGLLDPEKLYRTFEDMFPEDDFDQMEIPLRIIATDMVRAREALFNRGSVIRATLASCAFPFVFAPMEINGRVYCDGGIMNHFPADVIRRECDHLIGVYVSPLKDVMRDDMNSLFRIVERSMELKGMLAERQKFVLCDTMIYMDQLQQFDTFDTDSKTMKEIMELGYEEAQKHEAEFVQLADTYRKSQAGILGDVSDQEA